MANINVENVIDRKVLLYNCKYLDILDQWFPN